MAHNKALNAEFAAFAAGLDTAAVKMIASGEAIMKYPGTVLLAQMGLIPEPAPPSSSSPDPSPAAALVQKTQFEPFSLLDNACGPGLIAGVLQEELPKDVLAKSRVLCADVNGNLVDILKQRASIEGWVGVETAVLDAQNPGLPENSFDYSTVNFAMHIIPDPDAVLTATKSLLKPNGVIGITTMHSTTKGWTDDLLAALSSLSSSSSSSAPPILSFTPEPPLPAKIPMTVNNRPEWAEADGVRDQLEAKHGFEDVRVRLLPHKSACLSGADAVERFGMMVRMVTGTYWSDSTRSRVEAELKEKGEEGGLLGYVERFLDQRHGGQAWELEWTMVVATGRKPGP
ncbi:S-adenosyl-L-methionine-dependent methyltransferase [Microdochium trichocladiopsis]|uniref:S-adenosyl-L-methionine-dependent methyltransferase n=1 Tax=Microdochium trichocladiopsis TaxID=1682393 RepID=A0A9P9BR80_9PEZI|nr:S-adenosyl-L-methionine-dependent methyltransferase [Microdochium trichocladiopsis]KAH7031667.1 S-adenosyl-L-methionine-dependent methyltransferase [Microdochium trichocladiopsis]